MLNDTVCAKRHLTIRPLMPQSMTYIYILIHSFNQTIAS